MLTIDTVAKAIENTLGKIKSPAKILPATLLYCVASQRTGTSSSRAAANAIAGMVNDGIITGKNPDGSDNIVNRYTYRIIDAIFTELRDNAAIQIALPKNSLMVQTTGANAGGTLTGVGSNIIDIVLKGIIR